MAELKIGNAHNEAGEKFFASNSLTVETGNLFWNGNLILHTGNLSVGNGLNGSGAENDPLIWKGFSVINENEIVVGDSITSIKVGKNLNSLVEENVLTISIEEISWESISDKPDSLTNPINEANGLVQLGEDGKIPTSLYDSNSSSSGTIPILQFSRPTNQSGLHIEITNGLNKDGSDNTTILNTRLIPGDRLKVFGNAGNVDWITCPEDGFGSVFDNMPIFVDATNLLNCNQKNYIRYRWVTNSGVVSDWYSMVFPATTEPSFASSVSIDWNDINNKPENFSPSGHEHELDEINGLDEKRLLPQNSNHNDLLQYNQNGYTGGGNEEDCVVLIQPLKKNGYSLENLAIGGEDVLITNKNVDVVNDDGIMFSGVIGDGLEMSKEDSAQLIAGSWCIDIIFTPSNLPSTSTIAYLGYSELSVILTQEGKYHIWGVNSLEGGNIQVGVQGRITIEHYENTVSLYYDGELIGSENWSFSATSSIRFGSGSGGRGFFGTIKAIRVRNSAPYKGVSFVPDELPFTERVYGGAWESVSPETIKPLFVDNTRLPMLTTAPDLKDENVGKYFLYTGETTDSLTSGNIYRIDKLVESVEGFDVIGAGSEIVNGRYILISGEGSNRLWKNTSSDVWVGFNDMALISYVFTNNKDNANVFGPPNWNQLYYYGSTSVSDPQNSDPTQVSYTSDSGMGTIGVPPNPTVVAATDVTYFYTNVSKPTIIVSTEEPQNPVEGMIWIQP